MVLLRPLISQVVGIDPLARDGLARWSAEVFHVYANGLFILLPLRPGPGTCQRKEIKEVRTYDERH
jgi:hypothetical protein